MDHNFVFTLASLQRYLEVAAGQDWSDPSGVPDDGSWDILVLSTEQTVFVIHRDDVVDSRRVVVMAQKYAELSAKAVLQRIHRVALAEKLPIRLPPSWAEYHFENFITFFATPHGAGPHSVRWIAEIGPDGTRDVCFWRVTEPDDAVQLQHYSPPYEAYRAVVRDWAHVYAESMGRFPPTTVAGPQTIQAAVDLDVSTFGAVTQYRSYSSWLPHLTGQQREFFDWPADTAVKLRGPAGSGKTLALELKALRELYRAREDKRTIRILFATHSWAVAEQVDSALRRLDEGGDLSAIDVFPLLELARLEQPRERQGDRSYRLLGEDSLSGRREQLTRISQVLERATKGDWLVFRRQATPEFQARVGSPVGSPDWNSLVWDLMLEFSGVLAAHGILPGINAERRYLSLQRTQWMMPLQTDAEKRFVISIYTAYVTNLTEQGLLTSDQLISDFLNYLETFTWNIKRREEGYDLIFVDELHLFGEQERLALNYLARSAVEYPRMFMALDPRQSPAEIYADFPIGAMPRRESGRADLDLGQVALVELHTVYRFTPEILSLVQHIHRSYPALELGPDWFFDTEALQSQAAHGERPSLVVHATRAAEIASIGRRVVDLVSSISPDERIGVILIDAVQAPAYEASLSTHPRFRVSVIQSRDDVDRLRYSRRSVIVGAAEYLAGLQLEHVIVGAVTNVRTGVANTGYQRRRLLSLLYLAISRASKYVEVHTADEGGGIPEILETALRAGIAVRRQAPQ